MGRGKNGAIAAVALGVALLAVVPPVSASAPVATGVAWAYGGFVESAGGSSLGAVRLATLDYANYAVVLNQTNGTGGAISLRVERLVETYGSFQACEPNCSAPEYEMTGTSRGLEYEDATANLTEDGQVSENGTPVAALALSGETLSLRANLTVNLTWLNASDPSSPGAEWLNATSNASASIAYQLGPALGLLPEALANATNWTSRAPANLSGTVTLEGEVTESGNLELPSDRPFGGVDALQGTDELTLVGASLGNASVAGLAGNSSATVGISGGPAVLLEGVLLVPAAAYDDAGFGPRCPTISSPCAVNGSTPALEANLSSAPHLGLFGASAALESFALPFNATAVYEAPTSSTFWPAATRLPPAPNGTGAPPTVPGTPESAPQAEALVSAFLGGGPANSSGTPHPGVSAPAPPLPSHGVRGPGSAPAGSAAGGGAGSPASYDPDALFLTGVALAGIAAALLVRRKRPRPVPVEEPPPEEAPPPAEPTDDDPMGYVW